MTISRTVAYAIEATLELATAEPDRPVPSSADVVDHESLDRFVAEIMDQHGRIDILVNNAGFSYYERMANSSLEHWRHTQAVNLEAMFVLVKFVVPHMIAEKSGRIVNISSVQGLAAEAAVGAYAASKGQSMPGAGHWPLTSPNMVSSSMSSLQVVFARK